MRKGFTVPLILVLVLVLIMVPLIFWISTNNFNASSSSDVMGVADAKDSNKSGFSVTVNSDVGVWDLLQTACKTLDECKESVTSGKRVSTASGGVGYNNTVNVYKDPSWTDYNFLKLYVRAGWGSSTVGFNLEKAGDVPGLEITNMSESSASYDVAIVPLTSLTSFFEGPTFSK